MKTEESIEYDLCLLRIFAMMPDVYMIEKLFPEAAAKTCGTVRGVAGAFEYALRNGYEPGKIESADGLIAFLLKCEMAEQAKQLCQPDSSALVRKGWFLSRIAWRIRMVFGGKRDGLA